MTATPVHIEWARANTPPSRESFTIPYVTGWDSAHWEQATVDAVFAHWSSGAPNLAVGNKVVVQWNDGTAIEFEIPFESGMSSTVWRDLVADEIHNHWHDNPPSFP